MIPLFSVSQVRDADDYAINQLQIPGLLLMENASLSIYSIIREHYPSLNKNDLIGIVCGKGNNGGDGFALARHFINSGFRVGVIYLSGSEELKGDALSNFEILSNVIHFSDETSFMRQYKSVRDLKRIEHSQLVVDALLGTGASGSLKAPYAEIVRELNKFNTIRVALDIPTGLDADKGSGEEPFEADLTVTLAELKKGLFVNKGAAVSGEVKKGYIGLSAEFFDNFQVDTYVIEPEDAFYNLPQKAKDIYKYSAGKVLVIAGSKNLPGASFMTASSVLHSGAGASILCFPESARGLIQGKLDEVIVLPYKDEEKGILGKENLEELKERFGWMDVLAIGPGLGRDARTVEAVLEIIRINKNKKIVLDADALFALGEGRYKSLNLRNCVLTPHQAEFANLLGIKLSELQEDVLSYGREFSRETGALLVLKGSPTVIFNAEGEALINSTGNPGMAKFGTGDVLTGIIAGFMAQSNEAEGAVVSAVYLHSLSADLLLKEKTEYGLMATEIMNNLSEAIKFVRKSSV
ncbi:MAG: NAD(P)H-hydrate dehydratase [Ignavibacteria bacterium]|jgi:NAD(P)H-hydrate epimerase|nr:NAD(P)H-hydrate dehydratase [Ignavibacteria bacterium]MCU7502438.1 NAD(P)H-hydrate dehydratase [Ignavibacteria bacterium]MCU7514997.1 NAD(P)H-hydrate dehydratase [Ignavibacteria bacterium]